GGFGGSGGLGGQGGTRANGGSGGNAGTGGKGGNAGGGGTAQYVGAGAYGGGGGFGGVGGNAGTIGSGGSAGLGGKAGTAGAGANGGDGGSGGTGGSGGPVGTSGINGTGGTGGTGAPNGTNGTPVAQTAIIPITTFVQSGLYAYPIVNVSINGGPPRPVLLDSGATGLVINYTPTGLGSPVYSGGPFNYGGVGSLYYDTYSATVSFGDGIVTAPTAVDVLTPSSVPVFNAYWAGIPIDGVWGIGPNNGYPGTSIVITALPGTLNQGALIDGAGGRLQFGPNSRPGVSVAGAPFATLLVQIDDGPKVEIPDVNIDSGYNNGLIGSSIYTGPTTARGSVPAGTKISVYTVDGTLLYSYTTTATNGPAVRTGSLFNTGWTPYTLAPIYNGASPSGFGTTVFSD
ncbi:MAG: PecA family PE domain-processing aspartic protease, partial [Mycobacterium sp.]